MNVLVDIAHGALKDYFLQVLGDQNHLFQNEVIQFFLLHGEILYLLLP
jgi:hypothetical protein